MNVNLLKFLYASWKDRIKRFYFYQYCYEMHKRGVLIDRDALVIAAAGIEMASGSRIASGATIAAKSLGWNDDLDSTPNGSIRLGHKCTVHRGAILASYGGKIELGEEVSVNPGTILYGHGGLHIGAKTRIAANTVIIPANHVFADPTLPIKEQGLTREGIFIGCDVWIGTGVTIVDGVTVGDGAVLGAGCVVTKNVNPGEIVAGVPARLIGNRTKINSYDDKTVNQNQKSVTT